MERWQLAQRQSLPLEAKVVLSQQRIREWHDYWQGDIYVAFSGGKDSTVLLHLVRGMYPGTPAVFVDTGLEYPEVKEFVRATSDVTWLKPGMTFREVIERHGYPVISKEVSYRVYQYHASIRNDKPHITERILRGRSSDGGFKLPEKWKYLLEAPFKINSECCNVMKKRPMKKYEGGSGRRPLIGTLTVDARVREMHYLKHGCNAFDKKQPTSQPLSFWGEEDIWGYLEKYGVPYSSIYRMGWPRTGCIFCCLGVHMEQPPNRFQRMRSTHPKLHAYCMGRLGLREVLEYMGIPWE